MKREEKLLRAIGGADESLIAEAMEAKMENRPRVLRWAAVAACVCLLLTVTVEAIAGEHLYKLFNNDGFFEHYTLDRIPLTELSGEALAAFPTEMGQMNYVCVDSIEDAEDFLGIHLPDNSLLENALVDALHLKTEYGEEIHSHCVIKLSTGDKPEPYCVDAELAYRIDGIVVQVMYRCPTEKNPYDNGGGVSIDTESAAIHRHTTDGGRTWELYTWEYTEGHFSGSALGNVNGALTWIQIPVVPARLDCNEDDILELLIQVAEAYE